MGQQQLLLIILGTVVVGIAVTIGITMFSDNAVSSNRDAMSTDMMHLAAKARHYYGRPISMGGGSHSFVGITIDKLVTSGFADNVNGKYSITSVSATEVVFLGIGKVPTTSGDSTKLVLRVFPSGPASLTLSGEE
jgi:hypothetical protein